MEFERELDFFRRIAKQLHLAVYDLPADRELLHRIDYGLRVDLRLAQADYYEWEKQLRQMLRHNVVYTVTDEFECHYIVLRLPGPGEFRMLIVGPYTMEEFDTAWIKQFQQRTGIDDTWLPALEEGLRYVPYLHSDEPITAAVNALGEAVWGTQAFTWEHIISGIPEVWIPLLKEPDHKPRSDTLSSLSGLERRYEAENSLMEVVSQGRSHTAELMLANFTQTALEQRASEPTRNLKNYTIILNTLMRKAAENGGVHPIYIDRVSSDFAMRLEAMSTVKEIPELWKEMARKYCLLVKKHANKEYSPLVQKVIARVDFDLSVDLSLKANADVLNVNASYLSTLFKRETGTTLTDYVNRKRVEHAMFLLNTTSLSISAIGQRCGIQDDNYFTKIFKKYTNKTPKQHRQDSNRFSR